MFFVPIPRKVALERGLLTFFSGKPCKSGNLRAKKVSLGSHCPCEPCMEAKRKRERIRQKEHLQEKLTYNRQYRKDNPEKVKAWEKKSTEINKEKREDYLKKYRKTEQRKKVRQKYYANNKAKIRSDTFHRKYLVNLFQDELSEFVCEEAYNLCLSREFCTNTSWHLDHMIPLRAKNVCGLHVWNNFQCIPSIMNSSKSNKLIYTNPHEWLYDIPKFFKVVYQKEQAT